MCRHTKINKRIKNVRKALMLVLPISSPVCVCACVCAHTCASVCMCVRAYVCMCVRAFVCVCMCTHPSPLPPSKWFQKLLSPNKSNLRSKSTKMTLTAFVVSKSFFLKVIEHLLAKSFFQTIAEVAEQAFQSVPATSNTTPH